MSLDQQLTEAARYIAEEVEAPEVDIDALRDRVRTTRHRKMALTAAMAAVAIATSAFLLSGPEPSALPPAGENAPDPSMTSTSTFSPGPEPIDTAGWTTYESTVYDLEISHPPDWNVEPATHEWSWEEDGSSWPSSGHETFSSGTVAVSVWTVPLEPGTSIESTADIEAWLQDYCDRGATANCQQMAGPHVELCVGKSDCYPGLLVPFRYDVQAYFSGGNYPDDAMTIVAVWRGNLDLLAEPYLQAQRLLTAFLSTMDIWVRPDP